MPIYTNVLAHSGLTEEQFSGKLKRLINNYGRKVKDIDRVKNDKRFEFRNPKTAQPTPKALSEIAELEGDLNDINEDILDEIASVKVDLQNELENKQQSLDAEKKPDEPPTEKKSSWSLWF